MATSTIELARTIARSSQYARLEPLVFVGNTYNDPAFSNADWVMQTILAPPFAWRWNRTSKGTPSVPAFPTIIGKTDYEVNLPNFGWLEKAALYDPDSGYLATELQVELIKAVETTSFTPQRIATQLDDGAGNITFRLFGPPDKIYNVCLEYQNAAQLFAATNQTWAPVPDYLSYVYNEGFDFRTFSYLNDPRSQFSGQLFYQSLAQMSEGLTLSEKNIWLEDKLKTLRQSANIQAGKG